MHDRVHNIVFIGAGNLATNLAHALYHAGFRIAQVFSRTEESARTLAQTVDAAWTTSLPEVRKDAELYLVALKDSALVARLSEITDGRENALFAHTAGSIPMDIWKRIPGLAHYGVFYPLQTFSKQRPVAFNSIPIFIEASTQQDTLRLRTLANTLSEHVFEINSTQRQALHLASVFACNFTNHLYALADELLQKQGLSFKILLPLIDETARKVHELTPSDAQTGPAIRYDQNVISKHLEALKNEPRLQSLYRLLSESIHDKANPK